MSVSLLPILPGRWIFIMVYWDWKSMRRVLISAIQVPGCKFSYNKSICCNYPIRIQLKGDRYMVVMIAM